MLKTTIFVGIVAISIISMAGTVCHADKTATYVAANNLSSYSPENKNLGNYYVLEFQIPQGVAANKLQFAFLELYVDASSVEKTGRTDDTPIIEVYALKNSFSGSLDPSEFEAQTVPTARNVVVGEKRRVVIDITEIVRSYLASPNKNHGLIIGSLTGTRDGKFTIKTNEFSESGVAKITFFD